MASPAAKEEDGREGFERRWTKEGRGGSSNFKVNEAQSYFYRNSAVEVSNSIKMDQR